MSLKQKKHKEPIMQNDIYSDITDVPLWLANIYGFPTSLIYSAINNTKTK